MSWIKTIDVDSADDQLKQAYQRIAGPKGQVDNVLQIHSLRPHTLDAHMALYKATLHDRRNTLPEWLLECIGVFVSRINRCDYCDKHHTAGLQRLVKDGDRFAALEMALEKPLPGAPFSVAEQQIFDYVRLLTVSPSELQQEDIKKLQQAGYSDGQILEINQVAAYFAYVNRSVLGLGVDYTSEQLGLSPKVSDNADSWEHS